MSARLVWHDVTKRTRILVDANREVPVRIETTAYDLDAALDDAAQWFGEPLYRTSAWLTDDGRNPEDEDCGNNSKVTCDVMARSDATRSAARARRRRESARARSDAMRSLGMVRTRNGGWE